MLRIMLSYPRTDKWFLTILLPMLESFEVWYDEHLIAGTEWWEEIRKNIDWCKVMIFVLCPDSLASRYCMEEFHIARDAGKIVVPILIKDCPEVHHEVAQLQHIDMRHGLTIESLRELYNTLMTVERSLTSPFVVSPHSMTRRRTDGVETISSPFFNAQTFIHDLTTAWEAPDYDTVILLIDEAKSRRLQFAGIDLNAIRHHATERLMSQVIEVDIRVEYQGIRSMFPSKDAQLRQMGVKAFQKFAERHPDYDPDDLAQQVATLKVPDIKWCMIPEGEVTLAYPLQKKQITYHLPEFMMAKYPITNAQFQIFVTASDGYHREMWWRSSQASYTWHQAHPLPLPPRCAYGDHPRANISFYEAKAFCLWYSAKMGLHVTLPSEAQWQRAAQGDDKRRYPWGNRYLKQLANGADNAQGKTARVGLYMRGTSPYQVIDLSGNVWEMCQSADYGKKAADSGEHVAKGGSYASQAQELRVTSRLLVKPAMALGTVGFRVVLNPRNQGK